jgi:hypothetical protein
MSDSRLYDDDILLWSEQQAAAIRRLARVRDVPNDLDIENVAEEIESVGRSELAAVRSYIRLIFAHLIKLAADGNSESRGHWQGEIVAFHADMIGRYAPSMRQRIDLDDLWRRALDQSIPTYQGVQQELIAQFPRHCPFVLDDLIVDMIDGTRLVERLRGSVGGTHG